MVKLIGDNSLERLRTKVQEVKDSQIYNIDNVFIGKTIPLTEDEIIDYDYVAVIKIKE